MSPMKEDMMSRTIIARGAALAAATMLALTACGGTDDAPAEDREAGAVEAADDAPDGAADDGGGESGEDAGSGEDGAEEDAADDAEQAAAESDEAGGGEGTVVEVGTEFTDEETGDVITIVSAVRDNPTEYYMAGDNPDGEMIYLEVEVEAGDTYGGVISQRDFVLDDGGTEVNYAASADDELTDAG